MVGNLSVDKSEVSQRQNVELRETRVAKLTNRVRTQGKTRPV